MVNYGKYLIQFDVDMFVTIIARQGQCGRVIDKLLYAD